MPRWGATGGVSLGADAPRTGAGGLRREWGLVTRVIGMLAGEGFELCGFGCVGGGVDESGDESFVIADDGRIVE
jgi:hypothetical protein